MRRSFRAPGRVNLIGEHTDYSGGLVLPAALDLGVTVTGEPHADVLVLESAAFPGAVEIAADGSEADGASGWGRYAAAVVAELAAAGRPPAGFRGAVASDLPVGAGLASSAALEVAVALALCSVADFELPPLELAELCRRAEERAVGVPCGLMDQAAALLCPAGEALFLDCGTREHFLVPLPEELALLVVHSGVRRELESSAYARRRGEVEAALAQHELDAVLARRLRHVVTENERVREVVELLEAPQLDRGRLGRLFAAGHASLRDDFEVSTPELDLLVELAVEAGAVAARMTGAGFGGCIVALVEAERTGEIAPAIAGRYAARTGIEPWMHASAPAARRREP